MKLLKNAFPCTYLAVNKWELQGEGLLMAKCVDHKHQLYRTVIILSTFELRYKGLAPLVVLYKTLDEIIEVVFFL